MKQSAISAVRSLDTMADYLADTSTDSCAPGRKIILSHTIMRNFLLVTSTFVALQTAQAASLLVGTGGSIQNAINQSQNGDIIEVAPGTYTENINFNGKQIDLRSTAGAINTTINGNHSGTTVSISGTAKISGFTITGGNASFGAGMSVSGNGTLISNNIFSGNAQGAGGFGAAIGGNGASPIISNNIFTNNSSDSQFLSGAVSFVNTSSPVIQNNVFFNNQGRGLNLTLPSGSSPFVVCNTFFGNSSAIRIDGRVDTSAVTIQNNILSNNSIGLEVDFLFGSAFANLSHNLLFGNLTNYNGVSSFTGTNGNIEGNPMFIDTLLGNFGLLAGSSAIDAALNLNSPLTDINGSLRPRDGNLDGLAITDIGAYEFTAIPEPSSVSLWAALIAVSCTLTARRR
jgi:serine protease